MEWIKKVFRKKGKKEKKEIEEKKEYPDEIEIEWKDAASILNLVRLVAKTESDFSTFLFQTKRKENEIFKSLQALDDNIQEKITNLREENGIPLELESVEYEFVLPESTGKSGKFIKMKKETK